MLLVTEFFSFPVAELVIGRIGIHAPYVPIAWVAM